MARIFVIIGGFLVLLLTAALVVPPLVDWSGYRADFEREAGVILGRPVRVAGDVRARLLPFPSVTFSDVRIGEEGAPAAMTVERFSMDAELLPFLRGQVLIFDMRVERPNVTITLDKAGRVDWALRPSTPVDPMHIKVERLDISNGTITLADEANGRRLVARDVNAVLSATSLAGPWTANGHLDLEGHQLAVDMTSGEAKPDGSMRLRLRVSPEGMPASLDMDGDMQIQDGRLTYAGNFALRSVDMLGQAQNVRNNAQNSTRTSSDKPFFSDLRLTGKFSADRQRFDASEFRMEQGPADNPYVVNGKAFIDYGTAPRFEISADGQQLFLGLGNAADGTQPTADVAQPNRIANWRRVLEQLPIISIPGNIDLRLPAIVAGDTTIRAVTIKAEPAENGWNIQQFAADLPGRTKIEAAGLLTVGNAFGFSGDLLVASRQPAGLASWLNEKAVGEAMRKLTAAGFSGKVDLRDNVQRIDDLEIGLGQTTIKGSFVRQDNGVSAPTIDLRLHGESVESESIQALAGFFFQEDGIGWLNGQLVSVAFKAGPVRLDDMEAGSVDIAFRLHDGRFDFDRFMIADVAGTTVTATGTYDLSASAPSGSLDATILSSDLAPFLTMLANHYPQVPLLHGLSMRASNFAGLFEQTELNIIANAAQAAPAAGQADAVVAKPATSNGKGARTLDLKTQTPPAHDEISFSLSGKAGGMKLDLAGTASGGDREGEPLQMQLNGTASSPHGEAVLALIGLPTLPLGLVGDLSADLTMQGTPSAGMRTSLMLTAPDGTASFDGVISMVGNDIAASGKGQLKAADLQPFIATAGYALPGFGEGLRVDLASDFQFAKGIVRLPNLAGRLGEEELKARIEANLSDNGLPQIKGEVGLESIDLESLAAIMLGHDAIEPVAPTAKSVWPRKKFAAHPTFPLLFDLRVNAGTAFMASFGEMRDFSARIEKGASRLRLSELAGNWSGGFLTGMVSLESAAPQAMLSGELKWAGAPLSGFYRPDGKTPLSGIVKAEMSVTGSGENVTALIGSLAGAASIDIENFTIHGFDENALPRMLQATDLAVDQKPNGETLDSRRFAVIAEEATGPGHLALGNVHLDAAIAGGKVRIAPLDLATARAVLKGEVQLDLVTLALGGSGTLAFIHATDREAGLLPEIHFELDGNYDAPRIRLDRQPLTQFLTQRALEREQDRVEAMQAALMEKQALRRQLGLLKAQEEARERARIEEENRRRAELAAQEKRRAEQMSHGQGLGPVEGLDDFLKGLERGAPPDRAPQDTGKSPSIQP